jgi:two-component system CheB/CheR fusion protein
MMDVSFDESSPDNLIDLARLIRHVVASRRFDKNEPSVMVQVPETPVWLLGDRSTLEEITHLLINLACAGSHRLSGLLEILLDVNYEAAAIRLRVRVDGLDIEPAEDELAVVETLVEHYGGFVEDQDEGMAIFLPMVRERAAVIPTAPIEAPLGEARRVLVIEDNLDGSETLRRLLEFAGHEVRVAHTGPEGLRLADAWTPDYVFCDIGLPELDGYRVADELRRKPATATIHLIAITGYGSPEDRERSRLHGFERHFTKPADPAVLLSLLRSSV